MLSMVNGRLWQPAKHPPYKHGVVAYGDIIGFKTYSEQNLSYYNAMAGI